MTFTADQVWGLAVRADTQNDGYLKEDRWIYEAEGSADSQLTHTANKKLVKRWLTENIQPNDQEIQKGQEYRKFFNSFTLKALMGKISDFERQALRIAQMDEFNTNNLLEFALVSCLPAAARREQARTELKREVFTSAQLAGNPGDRVAGEIRIITCVYSQNYGRYRVTAQMDESFVDFWFPRELKGTVNITAKIKQQRSDNTTQLNYVKVL
jgi:hypothetical protein